MTQKSHYWVYTQRKPQFRKIHAPQSSQQRCLQQPGHVCVLSHVLLLATPWTIACWAPLSMDLFRQKYWSKLPFPTLGDLPNPGIEPASLTSPALAGGFFTTSTTWEAQPGHESNLNI